MTRIGPKILPGQTFPQGRFSATSAPESSDSRPKDLVELNTGDSGFAVRKSLKNAGVFFLKNCLPLAGAVVAGPPGLAVGAATTGVLEYLDRPGQTVGKRFAGALKKTVVTSAIAGGLGLTGMLWAPLAPLLQTGATALGTTAAGVLEYGGHAGEKDMKVNLGKFASEYKKRAQQLLSEAGQKDALKKVGSGFALSDEARQYKNQLRLVQTAAIVNHLLGPGVAVALAGDIGRERVDTSQLSSQIDKFYSDKAISKQNIDGIEVRRVDGLAKRDRSMGMALYNLILLDSEYHPGDTKTDFVLGHEMSHVRHNDSAATLAQNALQEAVDDVAGMTGSDKERLMLAELYNDLNEAKLADSRKMETRADKEGLEYAQRQGHTDGEILASALDIFGEQDGQDTYQQHPSGAKRMGALRQNLGE